MNLQDLGDKDLRCLVGVKEVFDKVEKDPSFASAVIIKYSVYSETLVNRVRQMQGPALRACLCCWHYYD